MDALGCKFVISQTALALPFTTGISATWMPPNVPVAATAPKGALSLLVNCAWPGPPFVFDKGTTRRTPVPILLKLTRIRVPKLAPEPSEFRVLNACANLSVKLAWEAEHVKD